MKSAPVHYHFGEFPPKTLDWSRLIPLIGPANASVARYDGLLSAIPHADILLSPLRMQEAVLSSKIEGTRVTIGEVLEIEAGGESLSITQPIRDEAEEVLNYRKAMRACIAEMEYRPLSQHIIRTAHSILMQGVRGQDKSPGSYRKEQNWIGPQGCAMENAHFVPISPEHLYSGMDEWERYLISASEPDTLVQLAGLHVEFEALHPFKDGNGRLGRMLIPLFLYQRKLLTAPSFYMSGYLEANRDEYQERLRAVSRDGDWTGWAAFFLDGIREQAAENERKARAILSLYDHIKTQIVDMTHSQYSTRTVNFIFQTPIFSAPAFLRQSHIPKSTASRILAILCRDNLLRVVQMGKGRRPSILAFQELLDILERKEMV